MEATSERPVLWHIPVSHYSEKVRWAFDYKQVPHRRRALPAPGAHILASMWLTGGKSQTFPVLEIGGRAIGDSTEIIATLEERFPDPPLYPADAEQRRRALELEELFDEGLGPHTRLLAFHELGNDRERFSEMIERTAPPLMARMGAGAVAYGRTFTGLRFGVRSEQAAEQARAKILAAFDSLEAELAAGDGEHLVGDSFGVADLTAAALFYPIVLPVGGPVPGDQQLPEGLERFRAPLRERPGYRWVEATYNKHRRPAPLSAAASA
ncbi:MAG TPA: glutathione S-transferase family protein [Solirubrobacterales bacterium]|nr:glutathione S-transferase family protein [Solirubrobacterales bacterium]